jgi:hypothetical protein
MLLPELAQIEDDHVSILDRQLSLQLNRSWLPIGIRSIRQAVVSLMSESGGEPPVLALDIEFNPETGELLYATPTEWQDWELLEVRPNDLYIQTGRGKIRAPTVTVAKNFNKIPFKKPRVSSGSIQERDGGICQYSGRKLPRGQGNLDHVIPLSRGGKSTFENLVWADRTINSLKNDRTPHEAGLTLIRAPKAPPSVPVSVTIAEARHPSWVPFLIKS